MGPPPASMTQGCHQHGPNGGPRTPTYLGMAEVGHRVRAAGKPAGNREVVLNLYGSHLGHSEIHNQICDNSSCRFAANSVSETSP
jgi:hypothetical protein